MNEIAKTHELPLGHPAVQTWLDPAQGLISRIAAELARRGAHPARSVVLVPYAQLMPLARQLWTQWAARQDGPAAAFVPRFESSMNWARGLGGFVPAADDISFDAAHDILTARALVEQAGLGAQREVLAARLMEAAQQLARLVAAVPPSERPAWAARARALVATGLEAPVMALESAVARLAVEWAVASGHASDALFSAAQADTLDALVVLDGFQSDPLAQALQTQLGEKAVFLPLDRPAPAGQVRLHAARDAEDEAARAAACVLRHLEAGRAPVALAAIDRALTRRIRAMLDAQGVAVRDENGWKLSTTRAAAQVMGALRACAWQASSDSVLDWLKNAPAFDAGAVQALEKWLRKAGVREWRPLHATDSIALEPAAQLAEQAQAVRDGMRQARPLPQWLAGLRELLAAGGQWQALVADAAGGKLLAALRLDEARQAEFAQRLAQSGLAAGGAGGWAARRISLVEFTAWVNGALEAASFVPEHPRQEQVVILPFSQLLGRPFAALVLPGCDEVRLPASPEPPGPWTAAQRLALGLPSREALEAAERAAWRHALQTPHCDVLWRQSDEGGEPLLPSPRVQALQLEGLAQAAPDPRAWRELAPQPTPRPLPRGQALPVLKLSASAYEDLRRCPYRFFALRQLGLQEAEELESEVDKRDFGNWLHAVLKVFHEALQAAPTPEAPARLALLEQAAEATTRAMHLDDGEFLPFAAAWPQVREGYLDWLARHEAGGARFEQAESWQETPLGALTLVGRLDRVDQTEGGPALVIDYKTESSAATRERIKTPTEDTQLAFYAALLPHDTVRAAYVNVGEDGTQTFEQEDVVAARDALVEGILHDMGRLAEGAVLPALGEGMACEFCAARGLCRKDFWS
ncbi:PD-(D/E)XK nuclease family protein [Variovorax terrae]|uniref:PD-(D/E)XK nuclease family protein n=1 Tax=Variovorax terrae TaxID=2923278 RepID=A0A9X1VTQ3_9BURK|nr:PD-(D/E)XK nuclease family protein [Variovorax terrae]MCJ0763059.1 PD-(D/E)XK nuclease family protein [Variovorax terrae]